MGAMPAPEAPEPTLNNPSWCVCGNCREMGSAEERECCKQLPAMCKSEAPGFDITILDRDVLRLAMLHRNDLIAEENLGPNATPAEINRAYRHAGYRQFILSKYGRLGQGVRRVIPSCCVWKIRDTFPDPNNQYKGWRASAN